MSTDVSYTLDLPSPPLAESDGDSNALDPLGNGIIAPFRRLNTDLDVRSGGELVRAGLQQLLTTRAGIGVQPGDLLWDPSFGSQLHLILHTNFSPTTRAMARVYISQAIKTWEPRVDLLDVDVKFVNRDGGNALMIRVIYALRLDDDGVGGVVIPEELLVFLEA